MPSVVCADWIWLSVTLKPFMLSVINLNVVLLSVVMLIVVVPILQV